MNCGEDSITQTFRPIRELSYRTSSIELAKCAPFMVHIRLVLDGRYLAEKDSAPVLSPRERKRTGCASAQRPRRARSPCNWSGLDARLVALANRHATLPSSREW